MGEIILSIVVGSSLIASGVFMLLVLGKEDKSLREESQKGDKHE